MSRANKAKGFKRHQKKTSQFWTTPFPRKMFSASYTLACECVSYGHKINAPADVLIHLSETDVCLFLIIQAK